MNEVAYINSQVACAMIEAMGMQADNQIRASNGQSPSYGEASFQDLITRYGIGHNTVVTHLQSR